MGGNVSHDTVLIATVAAGIAIAFVFGLLAVRLRLAPIVGYLVAGVIVGPFTPGYVADASLARQLADLGVILLMFGVGLHFSLDDLAAVRRVVVPGAVAQTVLTGSLGAGLALLWGWGAGGAVILGLSVGVASTVVVLKALERRDRLDSPEGRVAVGWLVVEDLMMVLALVLVPAIATALGGGLSTGSGASALAGQVAIAIGKILLFVALMFYVGRRFVPWLLAHVAEVGSRELFTLAVLAMALGVGTVAAEVFGVSVALGAFFAGAVVSESELSERAAADALPMQDAFAVLFFVSVGMLFNPAVFVEHPAHLAALVALIVLWKPFISFVILRVLGQSARTSLGFGASIGQIGEFSFIVAGLGVSLELVSRDAQALIVAASIIAIAVNAPLSAAAERVNRRVFDRDRARMVGVAASDVSTETHPTAHGATDLFDFSNAGGHVVLIGFGRVGATIGEALTRAEVPMVVVEEQEHLVRNLRGRGIDAILGDATREEVLRRAGIRTARLLVVTAPEPFRARRIVDVARTTNPEIAVAVRTHSASEHAFFEEHLSTPIAAGRAVYSEREAALSLARYALIVLGRTTDQADAIVASTPFTPPSAAGST